jgi:Uma2 family endonuclease
MSLVQPETRTVKLTYDDFLLFPQDGRRHELLDGEHVVTPSPSRHHQEFLLRLAVLLEPHVRHKGLGKVWLAPFDVVLSLHDIVEPDLIFLSRERMSAMTDANVQGAPDLLVEVLSPSTAKRDRTVKRRIYQNFGVREYWLADPEERSILQVRFAAVGGASETLLTERDRLASDLLPGWDIEIGSLFAD